MAVQMHVTKKCAVNRGVEKAVSTLANLMFAAVSTTNALTVQSIVVSYGWYRN